MERFLTIREAARELEVSEDNVLSLVKKDRVIAYSLGGECIRLRKEDVVRLKESFWTQPLKEGKAKGTLLHLLKSSGFFLVLTGICIGIGYYILRFLL